MLSKESTEGEEFIEMYLEDQEIKYEREVEISKLEGDDKAYRLADFYLPKFKVYVEFLGQWNTPLGKERYLKKMSVYKQNAIPCVYIFPDNLGLLGFIFKKRLEKELKSWPDLKFQLLKFRYWRFGRLIQLLLLFWFLAVLLFIVIENIVSARLVLTLYSVMFAAVLFGVCIYLGIKTITMTNKKEFPKYLIDFIEKTPWTFAKTYAKTWPHEYIVYEKVDNELFLKLADHIDKYGYEDYFYETKRKYFEYNGRTYWHILNIINRCLNKDMYSERKKNNDLPEGDKMGPPAKS